MFNNVKEFFKSLLSESYGNVSFMRTVNFMTISTVLGVWIYKNITSPTFVDFGVQSSIVVLTCIGGKVAQKFIEAASQAKDRELDLQEQSQSFGKSITDDV